MYDDVPLKDPDATLRVGMRAMHLPLKELPPPEALEAELEKHVARLKELRAAGASDEEIRQETWHNARVGFRAKMARDLQGQTHKTFQLQAFSIGNQVALVAMPGEPFAQIGMAVKQNSPFAYTLFSGYSNISGGYVPTSEAYELGGYEVEVNTPFSPDAAGQIVEDSLALLCELAG
jgi:hypothetical protein